MVRFLTNNKLTTNKMTKFDCTGKVQKMRHYKTDDEIIKIIGISKPTLYSRLKDHKWKTSEVFLIEKYVL